MHLCLLSFVANGVEMHAVLLYVPAIDSRPRGPQSAPWLHRGTCAWHLVQLAGVSGSVAGNSSPGEDWWPTCTHNTNRR